jgi:pimeloyl-ACP methyl ester carboxylesterase
VLALEVAAATPGITKLVLYEPPFIVDDSRPKLSDDYVSHLKDLAAYRSPGEAVEYFMTTGVGVPTEAIPSMKESPVLAVAGGGRAHALVRRGDHGRQHGRHAAVCRSVSSVTIPTLVIDGEASPPPMQNAVQQLVDVLPNARRLTMEGQTHEVDPTLLAPVLTEFFTS